MIIIGKTDTFRGGELQHRKVGSQIIEEYSHRRRRRRGLILPETSEWNNRNNTPEVAEATDVNFSSSHLIIHQGLDVSAG